MVCLLLPALGGCCLNRARTVRPFAHSVSTKSTMPESELPWLVAGLLVYYHRSNGDRVSASVVGPSPRDGRRLCMFVTEVRARCRNWEPGTCDKHHIQKKNLGKIGPWNL